MLSVDKTTIIYILASTLFLSLIYTFLQFFIKFYPQKKISKFIFLIFTFSKTIIIVLIIVTAVYFVYNIYNSINQFFITLELQKYVKNLSRERVLAKIKILSFSEDKFKISVEIYSLTGKIFKKSTYELNGSEFYIDFVVLNFDYAFIEKGSNNIAYPSVIFSDTISYDNGIPLLLKDEILSYLNSDSDNFIGLTKKKAISLSEFVFKSITDNNFARSYGIRSISGSALHHKIFDISTYKVYLQNTGGLLLVEENF